MPNTYGRQVVVPLTNKSGGGVIAGDVVILDTANNDAFTTTASANVTTTVGVAQETIASNAVGRVLLSGYAALINVNASVTRGNYGATFTVAKQASDIGSTRATGAFVQFLTGGTTPDGAVFPVNAGASSPLTTKGDIWGFTTVDARVAIGVNGYVATADSTLAAGWGWKAATGGAGGSDLVQTYSGGGSVYIPGFRGSPDRIPTSPAAADDEFNAFSGWTTYGTLDTNNVTDFPSHWHGKRVLAAASIAGIYKASPSMPFTMTAKLAEATVRADNQFVGLMVLEASPGKATCFLTVHNGANTVTNSMYRWSNATTFASSVNGSSWTSMTDPAQGTLWPYMQIIVASSTDVTLQVSAEGFIYHTVAITNQNPSLTIANVGLVIGDVAGASTVEAVFDWVRFT